VILGRMHACPLDLVFFRAQRMCFRGAVFSEEGIHDVTIYLVRTRGYIRRKMEERRGKAKTRLSCMYAGGERTEERREGITGKWSRRWHAGDF